MLLFFSQCGFLLFMFLCIFGFLFSGVLVFFFLIWFLLRALYYFSIPHFSLFLLIWLNCYHWDFLFFCLSPFFWLCFIFSQFSASRFFPFCRFSAFIFYPFFCFSIFAASFWFCLVFFPSFQFTLIPFNIKKTLIIMSMYVCFKFPQRRVIFRVCNKKQ